MIRRRTTGQPNRDLPSRFARMLGGTIMMGIGVAVLLRAELGLLPLDVAHSAIATWRGWSIGGAIIAVQAVLLLFYLPLGLRAGPATIAAAVIPAVTCDLLTAVLPIVESIPLRVGLLIAGTLLFAVGTASYLGADLGGLPRDGLMLALHHRRGYRLATIRVVADLGCLLVGALSIGPTVAVRTGVLGIGSVALAVLLGPLIARLRHSPLRPPPPQLRLVSSAPQQKKGTT
jgi:uncharacterized membrane protein YczE